MSDVVYAWGESPEHLKTRKQLAELGLRPGGPEIARIVWGRGSKQRFAVLYDLAQAQPKKPATPAQLAALEKARIKRESCPYCGAHLGFVPWARFLRSDCPMCLEQKISNAHSKAVAQARAALVNPQAVILDTETTGLYSAFVVQVAVIGMDGVTLLDTLVNPLHEITPGARDVHGITADRVADAPTFRDIEGTLRDILTGREVWTYNADFDLGVIAHDAWRLVSETTLISNTWPYTVEWRCAMRLYARWYGEWSRYHGDFRWQPLPAGDHTALGDCRATLALFKKMAADDSEDESHEQ